jgi:hypothetical protein
MATEEIHSIKETIKQFQGSIQDLVAIMAGLEKRIYELESRFEDRGVNSSDPGTPVPYDPTQEKSDRPVIENLMNLIKGGKE